MPAKKITHEVRQPDFLQSSFQQGLDWVKTNTRTCILIAAVIVALGFGIWGLTAYRSSKDDQAQYMLSQGMRSYQEYSAEQKGDALTKAEESFKKAAAAGSGGTRDIARLYLARIELARGKKNEALAAYSLLAQEASNQTIKDLAQSALTDLKKKSQ